MINTGSDVNAAYMNFLRCVRAICTAAAGTSSLTVNPFTNNTGTIDSTRNCIISIDANTEGGGWTESAASNVIQSGSFTAIASQAPGAVGVNAYKFDAYVASGKGALPYLKLSFHAPLMTGYSSSYYANGAMYGGTYSGFASYPFIQMTFGASTASDWSSSTYVPAYTNASGGYPNYNTQTTSWTLNNCGSNSSNTPSAGVPMFWANNPNVNYRIAVTANYCIIWEVHTSSSYINGYSNFFASPPSSYVGWSYGGLMYGGLRETQAWENSRADNPPWVALQAYHTGYYGNGPYTGSTASYPTPPNQVCAYMATINDSGVPSATATRVYSTDRYDTATHLFGLGLLPFNQTSTYGGNQTGNGSNPGTGIGANYGLQLPLWWGRDNGMNYQGGPSSGPYTNQVYMPTVDTTTGTGVPGAYPIMIRRITSGSWNPGGAIRGLYKSLSMPIATMKNYFANGQTFSIYNSVTQTTDTYLPIVFNETMYLVRYA